MYVASLYCNACLGLWAYMSSYASQRTALFWACSSGHLAAAKMLIKKGADVTAQNVNKLNCLDAAVTNGHKYVFHCTSDS